MQDFLIFFQYEEAELQYSGVHQVLFSYTCELQAVVGGSADVVSGAFEHTLSMQAKRQAMRAFVLQGRAPQCVFAVNRKTMPNFKDVKELKGRRIGVTAPGSSSHVIANYVLKRAGIASNEVAVRPETVELSQDYASVDGAYQFDGKIIDQTPRGNVLRYRILANGQEILSDTLFRSKALFANGDTVHITIMDRNCIRL